MQWILIMTMFTSNGVAISNVPMYDKETCDLAAGKFVEVNNKNGFRDATAFCTPRNLDKYGAVQLDK